jgi:hypothetical protein
MSIFKNQANLTLTLDTGINLSAAGLVEIVAEKPNGDVVIFKGTVINTTKILYNINPADLDIVGNWKFQARASFGRNNYLKSYGNIVTIPVLETLV